MRGFLQRLQNKPYPEKMRLLWITVAIAGIIIIALWVLTLKYRHTERPGSEAPRQIWETLRKVKDLKFQ